MLTNVQELAIAKFQHLKVGALFMQMGTGKTRVALELVKATKGVDLLIYVCPNSIKNGVREEIEKWSYDSNFIIQSYEGIARSDKQYLQLLELTEEYKNIFIVADESIFIKNSESKTFNRVLDIRKKCNYALILNGTPIVKNEWDLYNQMFFLSPLIINMDELEFKRNFFTKIKFKKSGQSEKEFYKFSEVNAGVLNDLVQPYIFKADLEFDKKITEDWKYIPILANDYNEEKEKFLEEAKENGNFDKVLSLIQKLTKITSCDKLKMEQVQKYITNKQCIVYCNYLEEVDFFKNCYKITGATPTDVRKEILEKFKNDTKPLVMTFGVGSVGLNLQFCNEIVYSSLNFNYGLIEQSKYRIKRLGQERNIKYTYILGDTGITFMIKQNLEAKSNLENLIKEKIKKGEIENWIKKL